MKTYDITIKVKAESSVKAANTLWTAGFSEVVVKDLEDSAKQETTFKWTSGGYEFKSASCIADRAEPDEDLIRAVGVLILTPATKKWLEANDPKALGQAQRAFNKHRGFDERAATEAAYDQHAARDGVQFNKYPRCAECGDYHDRARISCEQLDAIRSAEDDAGWSEFGS